MEIKSSLLTLLFLCIFISCKKIDSKKQESVYSQIEMQSRKSSAKKQLDISKLNLSYQSLVSQLKAKQISLNEFRTSVKLLLTQVKTLNGREKSKAGNLLNSPFSKRVTCTSSYPFDPCYWTYVPSECPYPPEQEICDEFYAYECSQQCEDAYFYATDTFSADEAAADANYQTALGNCNAIIANLYERQICINSAEQAYESAMTSVWANYTQAYLHLEQCNTLCPSID